MYTKQSDKELNTLLNDNIFVPPISFFKFPHEDVGVIIQSAPHKPLSWFRFIDDVDMKWTETEENLNRFFDHANNVHPTIDFTHETSRNNISFLDI
jgi:hypothetical protein